MDKTKDTERIVEFLLNLDVKDKGAKDALTRLAATDFFSCYLRWLISETAAGNPAEDAMMAMQKTAVVLIAATAARAVKPGENESFANFFMQSFQHNLRIALGVRNYSSELSMRLAKNAVASSLFSSMVPQAIFNWAGPRKHTQSDLEALVGGVAMCAAGEWRYAVRTADASLVANDLGSLFAQTFHEMLLLFKEEAQHGKDRENHFDHPPSSTKTPPKRPNS